MKIVFKFDATYEGTIELPDTATGQDIQDAIADFNIPEGEDCQYVVDSFEPHKQYGLIDLKTGEVTKFEIYPDEEEEEDDD